VQDERSAKRGASGQHKRGKPRDEEVLSPVDLAAFERGQTLKRYVRAAAAMNELYDDVAIAERVRVQRGTVGKWWTGATPKGETLFRLADATGLSADELLRFLYSDGPPPSLPASGPSGLRSGVRQAQAHPDDEAPDTPEPSPPRPRRDDGEERG
jgi:transcriptional regulator with XRE-family HTH domain